MNYIYTIDSNNSFLSHHGIKNQKWGVRNGPPYPIDHTILRKGTKVRSVSGSVIDANERLKSNRWIYTYNPKDEWDSKVYKGPYSKYLATYRGAQFIAEHEFETLKDLKMPTRQQRVDEFKDLCNDRKHKKDMIRDLSGIQKMLRAHKVGSEDSWNVNLKKLKTDADYKAAYEIFNHAMEAQHRYKTTTEYAKRMESKYDAMVDDNNQGVYNRAHDPVIIFKTENLISTTGQIPISMLNWDDITRNTESVRKELSKHGENVKL